MLEGWITKNRAVEASKKSSESGSGGIAPFRNLFNIHVKLHNGAI